jgi:hypothetical protein
LDWFSHMMDSDVFRAISKFLFLGKGLGWGRGETPLVCLKWFCLLTCWSYWSIKGCIQCHSDLGSWTVTLPEISILRVCSIIIPPPPAHQATGKCTCAIWWYIKLFKIGFLGNLPIAHDSLWVLEVMFIEEKNSNLRKFYTVHMVSEVWSGPPSQNHLKSSESICTENNLLKFNNFFYKHDLITPKISLSANGLQCLFHIPLIHFPIVSIANSTRLGQEVNNWWNSKMAAKMLDISGNEPTGEWP